MLREGGGAAQVALAQQEQSFLAIQAMHQPWQRSESSCGPSEAQPKERVFEVSVFLGIDKACRPNQLES
jgi:hypothetical protein